MEARSDVHYGAGGTDSGHAELTNAVATLTSGGKQRKDSQDNATIEGTAGSDAVAAADTEHPPRVFTQDNPTQTDAAKHCQTCGGVLTRKRIRKCDSCVDNNRFKCQQCDRFFQRKDMEKLCPDCLPGYVIRTMQLVVKTESFDISNELLSTVGQSIGRGKFIGPGQKMQPSGLGPEPRPDEDHGTVTRSQIESDKDDDDFPTGDKTPIRWLLNVPHRDLVSSETLQRHYGASAEEAAHILAQIDEIPPIYAAAIKALGWTEEAWLGSEIQRLIAEYRQRQAVFGVTEIRPLNKQMTCPCGADFIPSKPWHKYCSDRCSNRFRVTAYRKRLKLKLVMA